MNVETKSEHRKWIQIPLIILLFASLGATAWYYFSMYDRISTANVQAFIQGFGPWPSPSYMR
jgi:hypothetical protein